MNTLKRSTVVPFTAQQMFDLVNNIEDYPRFLPWCTHSQIISRTNEEVVASLEVSWKGIHKRFTTRNRLYSYERMEIDLVNGPLKHMEGIWQFQALTAQTCQVILELEFEFTGSFVDRFFQPIFQHIANTLVDAFCKRAAELYESK